VTRTRVLDDWYAVCWSHEVRSEPRATRLYGRPLVVWRTSTGALGAAEDRCPHRNVPLSLGRVVDGCLECPYHGWRFDTEGACTRVPGLVGGAGSPGRRLDAHAVQEADGLVWVWGRAGGTPTREPFRFPLLDRPGYSTVRDRVSARATVHATAENALDVPHTAFLHRGLFRGAGRAHEIEVVVRRTARGCEAEYLGEPRPSGLVGRLLAPSGGLVVHFDRFQLPGIAQVEYSLGDRSHLVVSTALTPVADDETVLHVVTTFRLPIPAWLVTPFLKPVARAIFRQDARILAAQTQVLETFGEPRFYSTEIDALGPHILHLLRTAERAGAEGVDAPAEPFEKRFKLKV